MIIMIMGMKMIVIANTYIGLPVPVVVLSILQTLMNLHKDPFQSTPIFQYQEARSSQSLWEKPKNQVLGRPENGGHTLWSVLEPSSQGLAEKDLKEGRLGIIQEGQMTGTDSVGIFQLSWNGRRRITLRTLYAELICLLPLVWTAADDGGDQDTPVSGLWTVECKC